MASILTTLPPGPLRSPQVLSAGSEGILTVSSCVSARRLLAVAPAQRQHESTERQDCERQYEPPHPRLPRVATRRA